MNKELKNRLEQSRDAYLDADWQFKVDVSDALSEIAHEKGGEDTLYINATCDDPHNTYGETMTICKVDVISEGDVEIISDEGETYTLDEFCPDTLMWLVEKIANEGSLSEIH